MHTRTVKPVVPNPVQQGMAAASAPNASPAGDEALERIFVEVGELIFAALRTVAQAAQTELSRSTATSTNTLVRPTNSMVGPARPESNLGAISAAVRDDLRRLIREPFVARVEVDWEGSGKQAETYYFSRPSVAGLGRALTDAKLVTSRADLGRLAEHEAGDTAVVKGREGLIVKRSVFSPTSRDGVWDALVRIFETMPRGDVLDALGHESLRQVLEEIRRGRLADEDTLGPLQQEAAAAELERGRVRRKVVDRIALRDQPILDKFCNAPRSSPPTLS